MLSVSHFHFKKESKIFPFLVYGGKKGAGLGNLRDVKIYEYSLLIQENHVYFSHRGQFIIFENINSHMVSKLWIIKVG